MRLTRNIVCPNCHLVSPRIKGSHVVLPDIVFETTVQIPNDKQLRDGFWNGKNLPSFTCKNDLTCNNVAYFLATLAKNCLNITSVYYGECAVLDQGISERKILDVHNFCP